MSLSGIKDIDILILSRLDDLSNISKLNHYHLDLCKNHPILKSIYIRCIYQRKLQKLVQEYIYSGYAKDAVSLEIAKYIIQEFDIAYKKMDPTNNSSDSSSDCSSSCSTDSEEQFHSLTEKIFKGFVFGKKDQLSDLTDIEDWEMYDEIRIKLEEINSDYLRDAFSFVKPAGGLQRSAVDELGDEPKPPPWVSADELDDEPPRNIVTEKKKTLKDRIKSFFGVGDKNIFKQKMHARRKTQ